MGSRLELRTQFPNHLTDFPAVWDTLQVYSDMDLFIGICPQVISPAVHIFLGSDFAHVGASTVHFQITREKDPKQEGSIHQTVFCAFVLLKRPCCFLRKQHHDVGMLGPSEVSAGLPTRTVPFRRRPRFCVPPDDLGGEWREQLECVQSIVHCSMDIL